MRGTVWTAGPWAADINGDGGMRIQDSKNR